MSDLSFEEILKQFGIGSISPEDAEKLYQEFMFQGFDPRHMASLILKAPMVLTTKGMDLSALIVLGVTRGNNLEKMMTSMTTEAVKLVKDLIQAYNVKSRVGGGDKRQTVTLSRVGASFPWVTCEVAAQLPKHVTDLPPRYPGEMETGAYSGLIPKTLADPDEDAVVKAASLHGLMLSRLINPGFSKLPIKEQKTKTETFINAGRNSNYVPESKRIEWNTKWGIIDANMKATEFVIMAADVYDKLG